MGWEEPPLRLSSSAFILSRLNLFVLAYFDVSGTGGWVGLGRVRVPILFGNYFPRSDLPYTKGFMKFGCPQPSKTVFDF